MSSNSITNENYNGPVIAPGPFFLKIDSVMYFLISKHSVVKAGYRQ